MNLRRLHIALAAVLLLVGTGVSAKIHSSVPAARKDGTIVLKTPKRPA